MSTRAGRWILAAVLMSCLGFHTPGDLEPARKALQSALASKDVKALTAAVNQVIAFNDEQAVKLLLGVQLNTQDQDLYWTVIRGLASFTGPGAIQELDRYIQKKQSHFIVRDILSLMKYNTAPTLIPLLVGILEKGTDELKMLAVDHLQEFTVKEAVEPLIEALKREGAKESELKSRIVRALKSVTGQEYGDSLSNWQGWWDKAKAEGWTPGAPSESPASSGTGTIVDTFDKSRRSDFEKLKEPDLKGRVVVIQSEVCKAPTANGRNHDFDHIQDVLTQLGIPSTVILKSEIERYDFKDVMAVLINCNQWREHCVCPDCHATNVAVGNRLVKDECSKNPPVHTIETTRFNDRTVQKVAAFVQAGGYLFTEDWELEELLERAFKGYVKRGEYAMDSLVGVVPNIGALSHPYLNRMFGERLKNPLQPSPAPAEVGSGTSVAPPPPIPEKEQIEHKWQIDNESPIIVVEDPRLVTVLMVSPELAKKFKGAEAVAITFLVGAAKLEGIGTGFQQDRKKMTGGRVLHVMSHFGKQKSQYDEFALQNMLLNFLIEANERRLLKEKKK